MGTTDPTGNEDPNAGQPNHPARLTRHQVAQIVLERIVSGHYRPGQRLPSQTILRPRLHPTLSASTYTAGLGILRDLGFLVIRPRSGTVVADVLPSQCRYAVTFPNEAGLGGPSTFYSVLEAVARRREAAQDDLQFRYFHGMVQTDLAPRAVMRLEEELRWRCYRGIIFCSELYRMHSDLIFKDPNVRRVCLGSRPEKMPSMPSASDPTDAGFPFLRRALDRARDAGARSVALVTLGDDSITPTAFPGESNSLARLDTIREAGLFSRPEWIIGLSGTSGGWQFGRLLLAATEKPDAVIITDDTFVPSVTAGMQAAGPPWPLVIGLANFPFLPTSSVPITFLGPDIEALLDWALRILNDSDAQHTHPTYVTELIFEEDWRACGGRPLAR